MFGLFSFLLRRMGSSTESGSLRRPPLHTCGVSLLQIGYIAYAKAQVYEGALSSIIKILIALVKLAMPIIYIMQYQWLAGLSFADGNILAIENIIEKYFPPTGYVFDRVDDLVQFAETLPPKFDDAIKDFPENINIGSFLDWTVVYAISCLNSLVNTLSYWGTEDTREKEITVDDNCNPYSKLSLTTAEAPWPLELLSPSKCHPSQISTSPRSPTYKEVLTNGMRKSETEKKLEEDKDVKKDDMALTKGTRKTETEKKPEQYKDARKDNVASTIDSIREIETEMKLEEDKEVHKDDMTGNELLNKLGKGEIGKVQDEKKMVLNEEADKNESEEIKIAESTPAGDQILDLFETGWLRA